jgi:hypothetical protein
MLFEFIAYSGVQHILCCVFDFLRLVCSMLPVSLDCPYLIARIYSLTFIKSDTVCHLGNMYRYLSSL